MTGTRHVAGSTGRGLLGYVIRALVLAGMLALAVSTVEAAQEDSSSDGTDAEPGTTPGTSMTSLSLTSDPADGVGDFFWRVSTSPDVRRILAGETAVATDLPPGVHILSLSIGPASGGRGHVPAWMRCLSRTDGLADHQVLSPTEARIELGPDQHVICHARVVATGTLRLWATADRADADVVLDVEVEATEGTGGSDVRLIVPGVTAVPHLPPGRHAVRLVTPPDGRWVIDRFRCADTSGSSDVVVASDAPVYEVGIGPGLDVECFWDLTTSGQLGLALEAEPIDSEQAFTYGVAEADGEVTHTGVLRADESTTIELPARPYVVGLRTIDGWEVSVDCGRSAQPAAIGGVDVAIVPVDAGEHAACTFTAVEQGVFTASVEADVSGAIALEVPIELDGGESTAAVAVPFGRSRTTRDLTPSIYELAVATEPDDGWTLEGFDCVDDSAVVVGQGAGGDLPLLFEIQPGDHITCTFAVVATGTISVGVEADPDDIAVTVPFTLTGVGEQVTGSVDAGEVSPPMAIGAGDASVDVAPSDGWIVEGVTCGESESESEPAGALGPAPAEIYVPPGGHRECIFSIERTSEVRVAVQAVMVAS